MPARAPASRRTRSDRERDGSSGSSVPYVYIILFVVLGMSLMFNAYLFINTRDHVVASRQEQLIDEQVFQQASQDKKDKLIRAEANRNKNAAAGKAAADPKNAAVRGSAKEGKSADAKGSAGDSASAATSRYQSHLLTPARLALNEKFSKRVLKSYELDALASFSHSFLFVDSMGTQRCLDRTQDTANVIISTFPCHTKDQEVFNGPQAWKLSFEGRLFTPEAGSVMYGHGYPAHTKVAEGDRCIAFQSSVDLAAGDVDAAHPIAGHLVLVPCAGDESEDSFRYAKTWTYNQDDRLLINTDFPSKDDSREFCLVSTQASRISAQSEEFQMRLCDHVRSSAAAKFQLKRLHMASTNQLTDDLNLQDFAFNMTRSVEVGIARDIGDMRNKQCQTRSMELDAVVPRLPKVSVILCFFNEEWFALLRSVWGVILTSPPELVDEILLVDDGSTMHHLHDLLDEYLRAFPILKARVVRAGKRIGLIQARLLGAKSSRDSPGRQLIFLDSHIEPVVGWMEPMVASIAEDKRRVLTPVIPSISWDKLEIMGLGGSSVGIFDWDLVFRWESRPQLYDSRDLAHVGTAAPHRESPKGPASEPFDSPTMAGGLFAIDKEYFYEIGSYDEEMTYWGAENLEISFRIWMCGGVLQIDPCSNVYHIFREAIGHQNKRVGSYLTVNNARLAKVWLDDYQSIYFTSHPIPDDLDIGDISDRVALRENLQCKSFQWYLDNFMPDMFIPDDAHCQGRGEVRNVASGMCLDTMGATEKAASGTQEMGVYTCHGLGGHQNFFFSLRGEIRTGQGRCLDAYVPPGKEGAQEFRSLFLDPCHGMQGNQHWIAVPIVGVTDGTVMLKHAVGLCLEIVTSAAGRKLELTKYCDPGNDGMRFKFAHFDYSKIENVNH